MDSDTPTIYDAFVCYNPEGADLDFVRLLIEKLEVKNNLKLFVPWRDDLPGASHNTVCAKLIEQRYKLGMSASTNLSVCVFGRPYKCIFKYSVKHKEKNIHYLERCSQHTSFV